MTKAVQPSALVKAKSSFDWGSAKGEVETSKGIVNGWTGIMMQDNRFFVGFLRPILLRMASETFGKVDKKMGLSKVGVRVKREALRRRPES